ncbi:uncharacterized protein LOC124407452 [Diprion similis]|uniref:uncharacterized protein LOC124407452 n=1 Tax=Diprion similis TaxID=362088 RepID=UPI001EF98BF7|nr:uncharacterized protein LOC124407452 [Diprion similis]
MQNARRLDIEEKKKSTEAEGNFDLLIPLSMILSFAEDYREIVVNTKQELILTRSKTDVKAIVQSQNEEYKIVINTVEWLVPYLKLADQRKLEKPRYVILAFQTSRKNNTGKNTSDFDHCNVTDVKVFLNSKSYPYGNLSLNTGRNLHPFLDEMYANFQATYYDQNPEPLLTKSKLLQNVPLFVIAFSKQNESLKYGPVDIRLVFEA